jgi:hypothetical protein
MDLIANLTPMFPGQQAQGISLQVSDVRVDEATPQISFTVTLGLETVQSASDGDGELFNQQVGQIIMRQLIQQLQEEPHV